ncbi:hypothetical protein CLOM_g6027 [Closterium sp. NIES-68]|nr:hypothetical protein CLOM_g6027 [Closterium sp. NIES-68]GJP65567.1 hypothetical protein CLOP_g22442 [Closterium sp. NIES-67]
MAGGGTGAMFAREGIQAETIPGIGLRAQGLLAGGAGNFSAGARGGIPPVAEAGAGVAGIGWSAEKYRDFVESIVEEGARLAQQQRGGSGNPHRGSGNAQQQLNPQGGQQRPRKQRAGGEGGISGARAARGAQSCADGGIATRGGNASAEFELSPSANSTPDEIGNGDSSQAAALASVLQFFAESLAQHEGAAEKGAEIPTTPRNRAQDKTRTPRATSDSASAAPQSRAEASAGGNCAARAAATGADGGECAKTEEMWGESVSISDLGTFRMGRQDFVPAKTGGLCSGMGQGASGGNWNGQTKGQAGKGVQKNKGRQQQQQQQQQQGSSGLGNLPNQPGPSPNQKDLPNLQGHSFLGKHALTYGPPLLRLPSPRAPSSVPALFPAPKPAPVTKKFVLVGAPPPAAATGAATGAATSAAAAAAVSPAAPPPDAAAVTRNLSRGNPFPTAKEGPHAPPPPLAPPPPPSMLGLCAGKGVEQCGRGMGGGMGGGMAGGAGEGGGVIRMDELMLRANSETLSASTLSEGGQQQQVVHGCDYSQGGDYSRGDCNERGFSMGMECDSAEGKVRRHLISTGGQGEEAEGKTAENTAAAAAAAAPVAFFPLSKDGAGSSGAAAGTAAATAAAAHGADGATLSLQFKTRSGFGADAFGRAGSGGAMDAMGGSVFRFGCGSGQGSQRVLNQEEEEKKAGAAEGAQEMQMVNSAGADVIVQGVTVLGVAAHGVTNGSGNEGVTGQCDNEEDGTIMSEVEHGLWLSSLSDSQAKQLEAWFGEDPNLTPERRTRLGNSLGLQPQQVASWFHHHSLQHRVQQQQAELESLRSAFSRLQASASAISTDYELLKADYHTLLDKKEELTSKLSDVASRLATKHRSLSSGHLPGGSGAGGTRAVGIRAGGNRPGGTRAGVSAGEGEKRAAAAGLGRKYKVEKAGEHKVKLENGSEEASGTMMSGGYGAHKEHGECATIAVEDAPSATAAASPGTAAAAAAAAAAAVAAGNGKEAAEKENEEEEGSAKSFQNSNHESSAGETRSGKEKEEVGSTERRAPAGDADDADGGAGGYGSMAGALDGNGWLKASGSTTLLQQQQRQQQDHQPSQHADAEAAAAAEAGAAAAVGGSAGAAAAEAGAGAVVALPIPPSAPALQSEPNCTAAAAATPATFLVFESLQTSISPGSSPTLSSISPPAFSHHNYSTLSPTDSLHLAKRQKRRRDGLVAGPQAEASAAGATEAAAGGATAAAGALASPLGTSPTTSPSQHHPEFGAAGTPQDNRGLVLSLSAPAPGFTAAPSAIADASAAAAAVDTEEHNRSDGCRGTQNPEMARPAVAAVAPVADTYNPQEQGKSSWAQDSPNFTKLDTLRAPDLFPELPSKPPNLLVRFGEHGDAEPVFSGMEGLGDLNSPHGFWE